MGSSDFFTSERGTSAQDAFNRATAEALHEHGHGGYTGTIAEKQSFTLFVVNKPLYRQLVRKRLRAAEEGLKTTKKDNWRFKPLTQTIAKMRTESETPTFNPQLLANHYMEEGDPRIDDKWGPAGCLPYPKEKGKPDRKFLFFGSASE